MSQEIERILTQVEHRPWPLPGGPWIMTQTWHDLLFAHWAVAPAVVRALVPQVLDLDLWDGKAYVAVTPFWMSRVRPRWLPGIPGHSTFAEINVRTYVTLDDKPGVFFFSLDAASWLAVKAARFSYRLPYYRAKMSVEASDEIRYACERMEGPRPAEFRGRYRPVTPVQLRVRGTLAHFLTERYCLYAVDRGRVYRGEIHHLPWPLQDASAEIEKNSMASADMVSLPETAPLLHFSREIKVLIWPIARVR